MGSPQALTQYGILEGERRRNHCAFRGIPFAKPPTGSLRFRAPQPPDPWIGVKRATEFGPIAPQGTPFAPGVEAIGIESEDCLYLNVYTPAVDKLRRPVMFWIHGGAFTVGAASMPLYDGSKLAELGDVVVVTTNYRLGALGFLYLGEHGTAWDATANVGQLDQIAALRWVYDNIESFGGDPKRITIFGESAGASSVSNLLYIPSVSGLFQRAVIQSGISLDSIAIPEQAQITTDMMLSELGIPISQSIQLQEIPVQHIHKAQAKVEKKANHLPSFMPVIDPNTLPLQPTEAIEQNLGSRVPLVIGTNRDETNLFSISSLKNIDQPLDESLAIDSLHEQIPNANRNQLSTLLETYRESRKRHQLPHSTRAAMLAINSDLRFRIPTTRTIEAYILKESRVYQYLFCYESPSMNGVLGACHGLEIPFVFGTLDAPFQDHFAGTGPQVDTLNRMMMKAWLAFAQRSDPNHSDICGWNCYDTIQRSTMIYDITSRVETSPFDEERRVWDGIVL